MAHRGLYPSQNSKHITTWVYQCERSFRTILEECDCDPEEMLIWQSLKSRACFCQGVKGKVPGLAVPGAFIN